MPTVPETIKQNNNAWLWKKKYYDMHYRNQQCSIVLCGKPGSGKTSVALCLANMMDRDKQGNPRFDVERIAFNSKQFFNLMSQRFPKGSAIVLDDAGLFALSGDALKKEVKELTKIFQSMRHRNYLVIATIPVFTQLAKGLRQIAEHYGEVMGIDWGTGQNIVKMQQLKPNWRTGEIFPKSFVHKVTKIHPLYELPVTHRIKRPFIRISQPPKELYKEYDKIRDKNMAVFYESSEARVFGKKHSNKISFGFILKTARDNMRLLKNSKGNITRDSILLNWNKVNEWDVSYEKARLISKALNEEI